MPDPRQASFKIPDERGGYRPKQLKDQYRAATRLVLSRYVPEDIRVQFETSKNLYLYSWFVYRFYPVASLHAFTCLELALKRKFKNAIRATKEDREKYKPGLKGYLMYTVDNGYIQNDGFENWLRNTYVRAEHRQMIESIERMSQQGLDEMTVDDDLVEITNGDMNHDFVGHVVEVTRKRRNEHAHGSTILDNQVFKDLKIVSEIISQIYGPRFQFGVQERLAMQLNIMNPRRKCRQNRAGGCSARGRTLTNLAEIIQDYLDVFALSAKQELAFYQQLKTLQQAIKLAATARDENNQKHPHQWRIPLKVLDQWAKRIQLNRHQLRRVNSFDELFLLLTKLAKDIHGIGDLAVYDTAHRIGAKLGFSPGVVYLHADVRAGAKALGLPTNKTYLALRNLPQEFHRLKPYQIEDCLCLYKAHFASHMVA